MTDNMQAIDELVKELREINIPSAGIGFEGGQIFTKYMPEPTCQKAANILESIAPLVTAVECIGKAYLAKKYPQTDGSEVWELRVHKKDYLDIKEALSAFKAKMEGK